MLLPSDNPATRMGIEHDIWNVSDKGPDRSSHFLFLLLFVFVFVLTHQRVKTIGPARQQP